MSDSEKILGHYGGAAAVPMDDDDRRRADAMAREKCDDGSCDTWGLLLARRVLDLLDSAPRKTRTVAEINDDHEDEFEPPDSSHSDYVRGLSA